MSAVQVLVTKPSEKDRLAAASAQGEGQTGAAAKHLLSLLPVSKYFFWYNVLEGIIVVTGIIITVYILIIHL